MHNEKNQGKQRMTEEELQRTQVLNFDDFKKTARIEKLSSKKPAIIVALIGLFSILLGASYPVVQNYISNKDVDNNNQTQLRKKDEEEKSKKEELVCTQTYQNKNGTIETLTIKYAFEDNKLVSLNKEFKYVSVPGSVSGANSVQSFIGAAQPYLIQLDGYQVTMDQIEGGAITNTKVNYKELDINSIPELNQANNYFNVIYLSNATKEAVSEDMTTKNYICE